MQQHFSLEMVCDWFAINAHAPHAVQQECKALMRLRHRIDGFAAAILE